MIAQVFLESSKRKPLLFPITKMYFCEQFHCLSDVKELLHILNLINRNCGSAVQCIFLI